MKKLISLHFAIVMLIGVLGVSTQAQSRNKQQLNVNVPFAFNAGNESLPAGDYIVSIANPSSDRSVLQITGSGKTVMMQTTDVIGSSTENATLTFRRYGDQYFLARVWMAAESNGLATR